jgi:cysteine desulfurase
MDPVYLDYNATAPLRPEAKAAVLAALELSGNASSVHGFGRAARRLIEDARDRVAALVGAPAERVVFTSGGTEANNLALRGGGRMRVLASAGEHDSVLRAAAVETFPLRPDGIADLDALTTQIAEDSAPTLVSLMLANNETGVIQPVAEAASLAHAHGALLHCDAVQAAGKQPVDMASLGADLLSLSAHKLGGPQGVGALIVAEGLDLEPILRGGGQERRRRAGTENLSGIAGFGAAAEAAMAQLDAFAELARLREALEEGIRAAAPEAVIFGAGAARLANTTCVAAPGLSAETQVMALDLAGIAVSAGSACSSGKVGPSHVLRAMGASEAQAAGAIRISLGWASQSGDIERFLDAWRAHCRRRVAAAE